MVLATAAAAPLMLDTQFAAIPLTTSAAAALVVTRRVPIARDAAGADFVAFFLGQAD